jgi:hypothetical protein
LIEGGISQAELKTPQWRFVDISWLSKMPRIIYTQEDNDPQEVARAVVTQFELQLSALRRFGELEIGPSALIRAVKAQDAKDANEYPIPLNSFRRFGTADMELAGVRMRYLTTSIVRPIDGVILDMSVRAGRASGNNSSSPVFDADTDIKAGWAKPVSENGRIYLRTWAMFQLNAPPSVRNFLGWERNHRGQPYMREWGRRFLSGRFQYHHCFKRSSSFPMEQLNSVFPFIKPCKLDFEIVPFYDIGAIGDPEFGWHKTRSGFGAGLHIILPPELVFRIDFAVAPNGPFRFYIGAGETI